MAGMLARIGSSIRSAALAETAPVAAPTASRAVVEQQHRGLQYMSAYRRLQQSWATDFSGRARAAGSLNVMYGPQQMGRDISFLRDQALNVSLINPHAEQAIRVLTSMTVMSGINLIPSASTKLLQKKLVKAVRDYFFGFDKEVSSNRKMNYWALERLIVSYYYRAGEVLVRARPRDFADGLVVPVSFEVIDPVLLFDGPQPRGVKAGNTYAAGIEFDANEAPEAYWLYRGNPRDNLADRTPVRVPVRDRSGQVQIVHLFEQFMPGQIRGIPRACRILNTIYEQQDYRYSILSRKRQEAKNPLIFKESHGAVDTPSVPGLNGMGVEGGEGGAEGAPYIPDWDDPQFLDWASECLMRENAVMALPPGWDVTAGNMAQVSDYAPFMADLLRTIAVGYGVPYSSLSADIEKVSFSGGKLGHLQFKSERLGDQNEFICNLHGFFWSNFATAGARAGMWQTDRIDCQFRYDAFPSAEPDKDARVIESRVKTGTISPQKACAEWGEDFYEVADEIAEADAYLKSKGLGHLDSASIMAAVTKKPAADATGDQASADDEDDDQAGTDSGKSGA